MAKEEKSLTTISKVITQKFIETVQEEIVKKYAQDMVAIMEDQKRLERALNRVNECIAAVDKGDFTAIEKYKKARRRLEMNDDADFE